MPGPRTNYSIWEEKMIKDICNTIIETGSYKGLEFLQTYILREVVWRLRSRKISKKGMKRLTRDECIEILNGRKV